MNGSSHQHQASCCVLNARAQHVHKYISRYVLPDHSFLSTAMATPAKKKKTKPPLVQRGLPPGPAEAVTNRQYSRSATSRLTATTSVSSSRSSTPLLTETADEPRQDPTEEAFYSDVDDELQKGAKKRKASSRSVSVSLSRITFFVF